MERQADSENISAKGRIGEGRRRAAAGLAAMVWMATN